MCNAPRHVFRLNRNLDVRLLVDTAEDLDGSPKLGSWNRLSAWHLASQETSTQQLERCEGDVDVVGVVTPLRGGAQVVLHGDQVVELSVLLGVHEEGEVEEDGEGQVEVEREEGEVKEKRTWMTMRMG